MCKRLFLIVNEIIPEILYKTGEYLGIRQIKETILSDILNKTTYKYIYEALSYQSCGCGFNHYEEFEYEKDENDLIEEENANKSTKELIKYIEINIKNDFYLWVCWYGQENDDFINEKNITFTQLKDDSFKFKEKIKYNIKR